MYDEYKMNARDEKEELRFDWVVLANKYLAQIFLCRIHMGQIIFFRYIRSQ